MKSETRKFEFDDKKHVYTLDGKRLYGITNVLSVISKPALIQWAANEAVGHIKNQPLVNGMYTGVTEELLEEARVAHRNKRDKAADKGKDIHSICEGIIKDAIATNGGFIKVFEHEDPMIQKFLDWAHANSVMFLSSEYQMFSETMWTAGTCDFTAVINGKRYMGDIKTYSGIYDRTPFLQCGGYMIMAEEMQEKFDGAVIVRIGKPSKKEPDGSFEVKYSYDTEGDKDGFRSALALFKCLEAFKV
jgi:hypothetical protein